MTGTVDITKVGGFLAFVFFAVFEACGEGLSLPLEEVSPGTNVGVTVRLVTRRDDPSLPQRLERHQIPNGFNLNVSDAALPCVDCKLVIENRTEWVYEFGRQTLRSGYDSLELDFMTQSGKVLAVRRRGVFLGDLPEEGNKLKPQWQWQYPVSFDPLLWDYPVGFTTNVITKVRPRFAYGRYCVAGKKYRTAEELKAGVQKNRKWGDRDGELVGEWIEYHGRSDAQEEKRGKELQLPKETR